MKLTLLDWTVIAVYFLVTLSIGLYYARRARGSTSDFFLSGRNAPWWLAGTSMVATSFAADTPLAVTGLVVNYGIAGNWLWWSMVMSGLMTVFFYARVWRRSGVMTDVEFAELRYSGKPAAFLRGFRALYLGIPINCIVLGWVNLAMVKVLKGTLGVNDATAFWLLGGMLAFTAFYTTIAGLWGVMVTDFFQFVLMLGAAILLAVFAVNSVGGIEPLMQRVSELDLANSSPDSRLQFFPAFNSAWMPVTALGVYLAVNWWATWYPGSEPGGGGYVAQRIFSAKNERHGVLATLWFNIAHYAIRPWPWILTALVTLVLYPAAPDKEASYITAFMDEDVCPAWLRGFMIAGFAAAYMSTISTQLNWGASYIINDFYRRFLNPRGTERHYVFASQVATVFLMIVSLVVTFYLDTISGAWKLLMLTGAGTGSVLLLRWYWWRINAWSEVSAMIVAAVVSLWLQLGGPMWDKEQPQEFAYLILVTVGVTTLAWLVVTLLTPAEPREKVVAFYRLVRPAGPGWRPIAREAGPGIVPRESISLQFANWFAGCALVYSSLFCIGNLIFRHWLAAGICVVVAIVSAMVVSRNLARTDWAEAQDR
jgi:SSS family solute:Na+ symporter